MFKTYYYLTKPGIIYGNLLTAGAGFLLASRGNINFILLLITLSGISLVIASACIINNYFDRDLDKLMERTKNRAFVKNRVKPKSAILLAIILFVLGFTELYLYTNVLVVISGLIGFFVYIFVYTFSKRITKYNTLLGSISGAMPPVAGYLSVTQNFDLGAILLFLVLVFWQMPHFYAIAIYRIKDYKAAKIPMLPVTNSVRYTKIQIIFYIILYLISISLLTIFHYTGFVFLAISQLVGLWWLKLALNGFKTKDDVEWAKKLFKFSIVVTMTVYILVALNVALP